MLLKHSKNTFALICILLACYMTAKETMRFLKNSDISTIGYKRFAASSQDTYPTFSICLTDDGNTNEGGLVYSYFKNEIASTLPMLNAHFSKFADIMEGQTVFSGDFHEDGSGLDIRNISEAYASIFTIYLEKLYHGIEFYTEDPNDNFEIQSGWELNKTIPFYKSYQDPRRICFTRKADQKQNIIRVSDFLNLKKEELDRFDNQTTLKVFVHHQGQLLRGFDIPAYQSTLGYFDWNKSSLNFKISQVSILRKRPDSNTPCNNELHDDDLNLRKIVVEQIGCIPTYWKKIMPKSMTMKICDTPSELKAAWMKIEKLSGPLSTYKPPCNEMKLIAVLHQRATFPGNFLLQFTYMDQNYQEVINQRDFELQSYWSSVGGFIGIFVGTSLLQVPNILNDAWVWLRKMKQQNNKPNGSI